jgi:hypothetical protein
LHRHLCDFGRCAHHSFACLLFFVYTNLQDFRSRGGIYPRLRKEFGMSSPEAMFDLAYFKVG